MSKNKQSKNIVPSPPKGSTLRSQVMRMGLDPIVTFSQKAAEKIAYVVDSVSTEVGWFGLVQRQSKDEFLIVDIAVPEQKVASTTCEISAKGKDYAIDTLYEDNPDAEGAYIGYWGHSHVNMGVTPSEQDVETAMEWYDPSSRFVFIASIHNKKGDTRVDVYDFEDEVAFTNIVEYVEAIPLTPNQQEMQNQIDSFVSKKTYQRPPVKPAASYAGSSTPPSYSFDHAGNVVPMKSDVVIAHAGGPTMQTEYDDMLEWEEECMFDDMRQGTLLGELNSYEHNYD